MLGILNGLTSTAAAIAGGVMGAGAAFGLTLLYASLVMVPAAHRAGVAQEKATWQTAMADAELKAEAARVAAQAKIDAGERSYLAMSRQLASQNDDLQTALEQERASHANDPQGSVLDRVAIPSGVSDAIAHIGRADAGRQHSAK